MHFMHRKESLIIDRLSHTFYHQLGIYYQTSSTPLEVNLKSRQTF